MKKNQFVLKKVNTPLERVLIMIGNLFFVLCLIVAIALIIFSSVTIECVVLGSSMQPTFNKDIKAGNDIVYVNSMNHDYSFGDIIVIDVGEDDPIIKRVIGTAGDVIDVVFIENNGYKLEINGKLIEEDYLLFDYEKDTYLQDGLYMTYTRFHEEMKINYPDLFTSGKLVVPDGEVFALGDNRHDSKDSTYYGTFKKENVLGIVELVRYHDENEFMFYLDYIVQGKFFYTIINCF